jgi:hypothetical protein
LAITAWIAPIDTVAVYTVVTVGVVNTLDIYTRICGLIAYLPHTAGGARMAAVFYGIAVLRTVAVGTVICAVHIARHMTASCGFVTGIVRASDVVITGITGVATAFYRITVLCPVAVDVVIRAIRVIGHMGTRMCVLVAHIIRAANAIITHEQTEVRRWHEAGRHERTLVT